jgi:hypothetical protein
MWNFALPIIFLALFAYVMVFKVYPWIKNSKGIDKLTDSMTSSGRVQNTTTDLIDGIKSAKDGLKQKSVEAVKTIKDATAESKIIDKALGKKDKE